MINASYKDKGTPNAESISVTETLILRNAEMSALGYDDNHEVVQMELESGVVIAEMLKRNYYRVQLRNFNFWKTSNGSW